MKLNLLSKSLPSEVNDCLTRIRLGRTLFGITEVHAGILDDPWCQICLREDNKDTEDTLLHINWTFFDVTNVGTIKLINANAEQHHVPAVSDHLDNPGVVFTNFQNPSSWIYSPNNQSP